MNKRFLYAFIAVVFCLSVAYVCVGTANAQGRPPGLPPGLEGRRPPGWDRGNNFWVGFLPPGLASPSS